MNEFPLGGRLDRALYPFKTGWNSGKVIRTQLGLAKTYLSL